MPKETEIDSHIYILPKLESLALPFDCSFSLLLPSFVFLLIVCVHCSELPSLCSLLTVTSLLPPQSIFHIATLLAYLPKTKTRFPSCLL